jgi:hypothetical protein
MRKIIYSVGTSLDGHIARLEFAPMKKYLLVRWKSGWPWVLFLGFFAVLRTSTGRGTLSGNIFFSNIFALLTTLLPFRGAGETWRDD